MTHLGMTALLVVLWILAWGQLTLANILSGLVVGAAVLLAFPQRRGDQSGPRLSGVGILRLVSYVATQLVESNLVMTRQILRRDTSHRPGVLAHRLERPSARVAAVMSSVIALSPGTMTVDVTGDSSVVYVHFFQLDDVDAARASLVHLEQLITNAIAARSRSDRVAGNKEPS